MVGAVVQLGAHLTGSQKVTGSTPVSSTKFIWSAGAALAVVHGGDKPHPYACSRACP